MIGVIGKVVSGIYSYLSKPVQQKPETNSVFEIIEKHRDLIKKLEDLNEKHSQDLEKTDLSDKQKSFLNQEIKKNIQAKISLRKQIAQLTKTNPSSADEPVDFAPASPTKGKRTRNDQAGLLPRKKLKTSPQQTVCEIKQDICGITQKVEQTNETIGRLLSQPIVKEDEDLDLSAELDELIAEEQAKNNKDCLKANE